MRACWLPLLLVACGSSDPAPPTTTAPPTTVTPEPPPIRPPPPPASAAPEPPPATGTLGTLGGAVDRSCSVDGDCVLVSSPCGIPLAVARAHAEEAQEQYDRISRTTECSAFVPTRPCTPACVAGSCLEQPVLEHADARACRRDAECGVVVVDCGYVIVSHRAPLPADLEAQVAATRDHGPPCEMAPPPELRCRFGFCGVASDFLPAQAGRSRQGPH